MRRRGRPALGADLVERLGASALARRRLSIILRTISGETAIDAACAALGVRRSMFHKLRARFLAQAAELLEPRPAGRRRREVTPAEARVRGLEEENARLRLDLRAQQVRSEIAVTMPFLLRPPPAGVRKKRRGVPPPQPPRTPPLSSPD